MRARPKRSVNAVRTVLSMGSQPIPRNKVNKQTIQLVRDTFHPLAMHLPMAKFPVNTRVVHKVAWSTHRVMVNKWATLRLPTLTRPTLKATHNTLNNVSLFCRTC